MIECDTIARSSTWTVLVVVLWTFLGLTPCEAGSLADTEKAPPVVSVGAAKIDVTPEEPIRLSGYGSREDESEGVAQRLWAKALAIGSDEEGPAVLITVDLIGVPAHVTDALAERLENKAGLDRSRLAVCATHTHTGPEVGLLLNHFGRPLPPAQLAAIDRYVERLVDRLERVALDALSARQPGHLAWGQGTVGFAANRRVIENGEWAGFGVNPDGPVDHDLPVLRATDTDGALVAVLVGYAAHATTLTGAFNEVHGDWPGAAQQIIEANHPEAVAMVAVGAGGDANPEPRGSLAEVRQHGQAIADEVERLLSSPLQPLTGPPEGQFQRIDLPFERVPTRQEWVRRAQEEGRSGYYAREVLERLARGEEVASSMPYPVQTWSFGDDLAMVFLAGEVVVDYTLRLKKEWDDSRLWVTAYANATPGYIASRRIIPEGGYEVEGSMPSYGQPSRLSMEVEDLIVETVKEMLAR